MSKDDHKIDADDRQLFDVLNEKKYTVDYFQREYSWQKKHIEQLVTDLTSTFLDAYSDTDTRESVENYDNYYLGPFVVSSRNGLRSIIDGQQRLTSLTLLLIFLNNLQKEIGLDESLERLIFSEYRGNKSYNIQVEERTKCLDSLFQIGNYDPEPDDDESTKNMVARYSDIAEAFPDELKNKSLPYFLDWLKYNVILVEITAYSDDNAYTIFESMNDRGLNLTSTEMLKGYILSRFKMGAEREKANDFWKKTVQELHSYSNEEDQKFFQVWLRSQFADTIRQGKVGSSNEDFEKIGTRFHSWFRDNHEKIGLDQNNSDGFKKLLFDEMKFYFRAYKNILDAQKEEMPGWESVFYHFNWGIADSLGFHLMLAPLKSNDTEDIVRLKINAVAHYLESFAVRRSVNFKKYGASSIRYTMYTLVKELRGKDIDSLKQILSKKLFEMNESWEGVSEFRLHGMNRKFVKFFLARITGFIEQESGSTNNFTSYFVSNGTKPFEVEHIWADKFDEHRDEFEQQHEFQAYRNRVGGLVLLPKGTNQSYGAKTYHDKVEHYIKENLLVKSLNSIAYQNNPNFIAMLAKHDLPFRGHKEFKKADIDERQNLIKIICHKIWG